LSVTVLDCTSANTPYKEKPRRKNKASSSNWFSYFRLYTILHEFEDYLKSQDYQKPLQLILFEEPEIHTKDWLWKIYEQTSKSYNESTVFPDDVKSFIARSNLPKDTQVNLASVIKNIEEYLDLHNEKFRITTGLFADPEEDESEEVQINIEIKRDLEYINKNLRTSIYDIVSKALPLKSLEKILINLGPQ
jgi:hypothetical protein